MTIRSIAYLIIPFFVAACQPKDKKQVTELIKEWDGKEIIFPKEMNMVQVGDSVHNALPLENYKIIIYVDTNGCFTCKLHLMEWEDFITELDSVPALFYFVPRNTEEVKTILKENLFYYPVCIDEKDSLNKLNHFPKDERFHTFLLDHNNQVKAIGNPVLNPKIRELYLKVITGDTLPKKEIQKTTVSYEVKGFDMGEVKVKEKQEATFSIENTGQQPLIVMDITTSCGCATPRFEKKPIKPGDAFEFSVEMKPDEAGYFEKTVSVYCNTPDSPIQFKLKGTAVEDTK